MYLFITGSTGTDKTKLSNKLTHHFKENKKIILISCDSVQIYEELNIGTNKELNNKKEASLKGINLVTLKEGIKYDVEKYIIYVKSITNNEIDTLFVFVGGSMFYMERLIIDTINNEPNRVISVIYLYKNRLTLYKETDLRCEEMILKGLLNECIDYFHLLNNNNLSLNIINSIGYRSGKIYLTSDNFTKHNTPYNQKDFLNFLNDFQTRTRNYIRKQTSFFSRFYKKFSNKIPITIINSSEEEVFNKIIDFLLSIINKTTIPINDTLPKPTLQEYKLLKIYKPEIKLLNKEVINNLINKLIKRINQSELLSYFD